METKKVYMAIAAVTAKLAKDGISKDRKNVQQGYQFRGIDDVYNALAPFLSEAKLCILPKVLSREVVERQTQKGGTLFYVTVQVDFSFVSAEDGSIHNVVTYGEAMDSGDKATNKAMSAAYKYAAMQAFCIPTEGDNDADATTHTIAAKATITPTTGAWEKLDDAAQSRLTDVATFTKEYLADGDIQGAVKYIDGLELDADAKVALWTRFDSKQRSAMKREKQEMAMRAGLATQA